MNVLIVGNKQFPDGDYRVQVAGYLPGHHFVLAVPERPPSVPRERFFRLGFSEGVRARDLASWVRLARYLRRHRGHFDVVHFFATQLILIGPLVARGMGFRAWITVTGYGRVFAGVGLRARILQVLYRLLFRGAVLCSHRAYFQNRGDQTTAENWLPGQRDKMCYLGSAVSFPRVLPRSGTGPLRVLLVSRLLPSKGIDTYLDAAEEWRRRDDVGAEGVRFTLVGPKSGDYPQLFQRVLSAHEGGIVDYRGEVLRDELVEVWREHDILYFPSRGEGMARVMLEAGFMGLCPIASDIAANRDLIDDGRGFLVAPNNPAEAVDVLYLLSGNRDLMRRNAAQFQEFVVREFSMEAYAARLSGSLDSLPHNGSGGP